MSALPVSGRKRRRLSPLETYQMWMSIVTGQATQQLPLHCSVIEFTRDVRIGVLMIRIPSLTKTASTMLVNFESRSRIKNLNCDTEVHEQVAGLLGHSVCGGTRGDVEDVDPAGGVLDDCATQDSLVSSTVSQ